ncbi:MAG: superinfection immunity protein [Terriglobales bacterium]
MLTFSILAVLYFLPTLLAHNKQSFLGVFLLNLFLGWTVVGWFAALVWALAAADALRPVLYAPVGNYCGACGTPGRQPRCPHCGRAWA